MNTAENRISRDLLAKLLLKHAGCTQEQQNELKGSIMKSIRLHMERMVELVKRQMEADVDVKEVQKSISHMDDFLTQSCRQRINELCPEEEIYQGVGPPRRSRGCSTPKTVGILTDAPTYEKKFIPGNDAHVRVIKKHSKTLTRDLRTEGAQLLDILRQKKALSSDGRQSIIARKTTYDKNSAFLKYCNSLSSKAFQENVIPALEQSNDESNEGLARMIKTEIERFPRNAKKDSKCLFHKIRSTVNHRRLASELYRMNVISDQVREDLSSEYLSNDAKWDKLLALKRSKSLAIAMKKKYPELYTDMQLSPHIITTCTCTCPPDTDTSEDTEQDAASDFSNLTYTTISFSS